MLTCNYNIDLYHNILLIIFDVLYYVLQNLYMYIYIRITKIKIIKLYKFVFIAKCLNLYVSLEILIFRISSQILSELLLRFITNYK